MRKFIDITTDYGVLMERFVRQDRGAHMTGLTTSPDILQNPAFRQWFGKSQVVDREGNPLVCYHGTFEDFVQFQHVSADRQSSGFNRLGFWFDVGPETPAAFAGYREDDPSDETGSIMPVYLKIERPFHIGSGWLFPVQRDEYRELYSKWLTLAKQFETCERDDLGNLRTPDGKYFDERALRKARAAVEQYEKDLHQELGEGFFRLLDLLPNGMNSTDAEVDAFKAEVIAEGYDGFLISDTTADWGSRQHKATDWWLAFHPNQIKSVYSKSFTDSPNIHEGQGDR
jgi:hypothetical protein